MQKKVRLLPLLFLSLSSASLLTACKADKSGNRNSVTQNNTQPPVVYENQEAKPTMVIPANTERINSSGRSRKAFEAPPKVILNTYTKPKKQIPAESSGDDSVVIDPAPVVTKPVEIILGQIQLNRPLISYNSNERKMTIKGEVIVLDQNRQTLSKKEFQLEGTHGEGQPHVSLDDLTRTTSDDDLLIKSISSCSVNSTGAVNCGHVVSDIFVSYKGQYYTEQIEVDITVVGEAPKKSGPEKDEVVIIGSAESDDTTVVDTNDLSDTIIIEETDPKLLPLVEFKPAASGAETIERPDVTADENELISSDTQIEAGDESIQGRYQGHAATVDLDKLFVRKPKRDTEVIAPLRADNLDAKNIPIPKENPRKKKKAQDKIITPETMQLASGELRPINQAIGIPNKGEIKNSISIYDKQKLESSSNFEVADPSRKKHFSTYEMMTLIKRVAAITKEEQSKKLYVGNISLAKGGKVIPHASHQNGLDADLPYPTDGKSSFPVVVKMKPRKYFKNNYSIPKTYSLFKKLFSQSDIGIDRIFIDKAIKASLCQHAKSLGETKGAEKELVQHMFQNLQHVYGHGDHFHVRIKCSKYDSRCRTVIYKKEDRCI